MRDNEWLQKRLDEIWLNSFSDVPRNNIVKTRFKGRWKNKFGHIRMLRDKSTEIVVNGVFRNEIIPEYIIDLTIAHELVHYSHGFHSPLPRMYRYPHQGGVVNQDLKRRGFAENLRLERKWIKTDWLEFVKQEFPLRRRIRRTIFRFF